jgi:undecaprenyl phosphate-alpha-L-ara4FN deformylase
MEIALKVDVDTHRGLGEGVPRLMKALTAEGVTATFFVAMGPDNSGRAIWRAVKNPGFLAKMRRTRAVSMYGMRTVLSGTILPARAIALAFPQILRELVRTGFELGVHGYDHVRWQDHIDELGHDGVRREIADGFEAYRAAIGTLPRSFAAPGWRTNRIALRVLDEIGPAYHSDTRGRGPYRCRVDREILKVPEIPTTLPTMDEVMGMDGLESSTAMVRFYMDRFARDALNVHTIHAETEGIGQLETLVALVRGLKQRRARFVQLADVVRQLTVDALPVCEVIRTTLAGRAGWVSVQGPAAPG